LRLASYIEAGERRVGVVRGETVHRLADQRPLIEQIETGVDATGAADAGVPLSAVILEPPVRPRRNIVCVGWNYLAHFDEGKGKRGGGLQDGAEMPEHPAFFTKATFAAAGPFEDLPLHAHVTSKMDWEAELAVVIGRAGADIAEADALQHVFGYMVANDLSAREVQRRHGGQWFKGKSLDKCCPLGPVLVTRDEVPDPQALAIGCRVNGVEKQKASTAQMAFPITRIIAELSAGMTLLPGDVILTGTPGRCRLHPRSAGVPRRRRHRRDLD
jgi:2,4-didehydro-3-deoxy-L-rhamnonate hydrolase